MFKSACGRSTLKELQDDKYAEAVCLFEDKSNAGGIMGGISESPCATQATDWTLIRHHRTPLMAAIE